MNLLFLIIPILTVPVFVSTNSCVWFFMKLEEYDAKIKDTEEKILTEKSNNKEQRALKSLNGLITFMSIDPYEYTDAKWKEIEEEVKGLTMKTNERNLGTKLLIQYPVDNIENLLSTWGDEYDIPYKMMESIKEDVKSKTGLAAVKRVAELNGENEVTVGRIAFSRVQNDSKFTDVGISTEKFKFVLPLEKFKVREGFNERCRSYYSFRYHDWCSSAHWIEYKFKHPKIGSNEETSLGEWMEYKLLTRYKNLFGFKIDENNKLIEALNEKINLLEKRKKRYDKIYNMLVDMKKKYCEREESGNKDIANTLF